MLKRIIVAFLGIPLLIFLILSEFLHGLPFLLFLILLNILALNEMYYIFSLKEIKIDRIYLITCGVLMIICLYLQLHYLDNMEYLFNIVFILSICIYFISLIFQKDYKDAISKIAYFTFGLFYISYLSSYSLLLKSIRCGQYYLFLIITLIWCNDSFAYFGGLLFGNKKLKIKASPNKTYAGLYAGIAFSIIAVFISELIFKEHVSFTLLEKFFIGIVFGVLVILSDLLESVLKRSVSIKDSKNFLPGHGGVLDVFDSWFLTIPLFYFYINYFH